jgi:CubicO group peptidase (beta-lactamase class C family)
MTSKPIISILLILILFTTGCTSTKSVSVQVPEPDYWPTAGWQNSTPEAQGMDSALLAQMLEDISAKETSIYSVLVIRNGYMVTEAYFHPYTRDTKMHIQSVTKSVIGMLVGRAISTEHITGADAKLSEFYKVDLFENPNEQKNSIRLKHLLSMSSGLDCQEFSGTGPSMEQTDGWVKFMLDLPMAAGPGETFGYCNGNAHLLSAILEKSTGMNAREFANQELFKYLGISSVAESDWWGDPQKITTGGYGLHLRPVDMAKLAFLYLHRGQWEDMQLIDPQWVDDSTTEQVQKEDGSGYGYLWTVYPEAGHYAALGLGGQQIHVYPAKNLIIIVTASLEAYADAPEIERMLNEYILPAVKSDRALAENPGSNARLESAVEMAANPVQSVPELPPTALENANLPYTFGENPFGWKTLEFVFEPGAELAQLILDEVPLQIGLDNIYRASETAEGYEMLLRGRWADESTFVIDYPYPLSGVMVLGDLGESEFQFRFTADKLEVTVQQLVFGGEPIVIEGTRTAEK